MTTPLKVLITIVFTVLLHYCWFGMLLSYGVTWLLSDLFASFGSSTPKWLESAVVLPMAIGWLAMPIAAFALAFLGIY